MGLSVGPQSFASVPKELRAAQGRTGQAREETPLDPLIEALGRAVQRSQTALQAETPEQRD